MKNLLNGANAHRPGISSEVLEIAHEVARRPAVVEPTASAPYLPAPPPDAGVGRLGHSGWLKVEDAARHAGVSRDSIYTAVERGELRHVRIGGRRAIRFRVDWIDEWLERHASGPAVADRAVA